MVRLMCLRDNVKELDFLCILMRDLRDVYSELSSALRNQNWSMMSTSKSGLGRNT